MDYEKRYRVEINKLLDCGEENIFFYWKGRVTLYALLKAMGVGPGDDDGCIIGITKKKLDAA